MLERGRHANGVHATHVGGGERGHHLRVFTEGAVADGAVATAEVDHRREAEVHTAGAHLAGHQPGVLLGQRQRPLRIGRVQRPDLLQRRQLAVAFTETLHAAAFLVDADQLRARGGGADRRAQIGHLLARGKVALEQHHPGHGIVLQPVTFLGGQFGAGNADQQHGRSPQRAPAWRSAALSQNRPTGAVVAKRGRWVLSRNRPSRAGNDLIPSVPFSGLVRPCSRPGRRPRRPLPGTRMCPARPRSGAARWRTPPAAGRLKWPSGRR
ncbi:hypothetical protein G6F65_017524 [Rhizopus arrhizus]|nr:hypothetical protein G6F65_017524 [Rhizopus arrhizus]